MFVCASKEQESLEAYRLGTYVILHPTPKKKKKPKKQKKKKLCIALLQVLSSKLNVATAENNIVNN